MRRNAVLLTILFAFAVTLVSVTFVFWEFYKNNRAQYIDNIFNKYTVITQIYREHMMKHTSEAILEANLAVYGLSNIQGNKAVRAVFDKADVLKRVGFQEVVRTMHFSNEAMHALNWISDLRATMLESQGKIYFFLETPQGRFLLLDEQLRPYFPTHLLSAYLTIVFVIVWAVFIIWRRIRPLRLLTKRVMRYAEGDRNVVFRMKGSNEIAILANELEQARKNINALIESRTLFLRNVMHELKTPIAKGRISAELLADPKQKARFNNIFLRLEQLINEFAMIEEASSGFGNKNIGTYRLVDLIDEAIDQSMLEPEMISVDVESSERMACDFTMMATVIKNMIDNGVKYSPDKRVAIRMEGKELVFENLGEKLRHPLRYYLEPFTKEHPARNSFGLGLYLVDAILHAHGLQLAYAYENGLNRFYITAL
ncbi:MAG: HAMP domain-containing histidine kinase [Campylobacterales bacterium]|nr:HAMP domain-containing histidine kinase [Campylobacterales bacterium]